MAFDAKDTERFTRENLLNIPHSQWPDLIFRFQLSVQITAFSFNTMETWQALKQQAPEPVSQFANVWLLWRNNERLTQFRSISQQEHTLIKMMLNGSDFASLCDQLFKQHPIEDVSQLALNYLLSWLDDGILAGR